MESKGSKALIIVLLAVLAIALGILGDLVITLVERVIYPLEYTEYVEAASKQYGVPEHLIYAVIKTESDFESGAVSGDGAVGLMQLLPATFEDITRNFLFEHLDGGMIYDPETNIRYGTYYLSYLYERYGDWRLALAAYNGGLGNVDKWLTDDRYSDGEGGLKKIPFGETRNYVSKTTRAWDAYDRLYGQKNTEK